MTPDQHEDDVTTFDPALGLVIAPSWWALGRQINAFHRAEAPEKRRAAAHRWVEKLFEQRGDEFGPDTRAALTPVRLQHFGETVTNLLERKYRGEEIGQEVLALIRLSAKVNVQEDGQFLKLQEEPDVWWATEYSTIFDSLAKFDEEAGWIEAAGTCANEPCQRFYIKRRANQLYHSDACQAASANRRSYQKKRTAATHRSPARSSR